MMNEPQITYFHRNPKIGFSIGRVFSTITEKIRDRMKIAEYNVPSDRALVWSILQNIYFVFQKRNKKGINHVTGDIHYCIIALIGCKSVLTIHDLVVIDKKHNIIKRWIKYLLWIYLPVKLANEVVCISENTKNELLTYVKKRNISVIYNPVDDIFQTNIKKFEYPPQILHIGCGWNKNLTKVINALQEIDCHLRIIGKIQNSQLVLLDNLKINYSIISGISNEEIVKEYKSSDIISFPSIYEGFGMPIIEGQKTGRIVLTSQIEPLMEVGGDGVYYINPNTIESIRNGFLEIIGNPIIRQNIINKGLKNVRRFDPINISSSYINLYENI